MRGDELLDLGDGLFERGLGDVGHEDVGTLLDEQDRGLETNAAGNTQKTLAIVPRDGRGEASLPSGTGDDGVLAGQTTRGLGCRCHDECVCVFKLLWLL